MKKFSLITAIVTTILFLWNFIAFTIATFDGDVERMISNGVGAIVMLILSNEARNQADDYCR